MPANCLEPELTESEILPDLKGLDLTTTAQSIEDEGMYRVACHGLHAWPRVLVRQTDDGRQLFCVCG